MKFFQSIVCLALVIGVGCATNQQAKPPENLSKLYTAHEVLIRIQELQRTVISLSDNKVIQPKDAQTIVLFTTSAAEIIQASFTISVTNWQQVIKTSWIDLKKDYVPTDPNLKIVWAFVDQMIMTLSLNNPVEMNGDK